MQIISGRLALFTERGWWYPNNPNTLGIYPDGSAVTKYSVTPVREGGVTKYRTPDWDISKNYLEGAGRNFSFWSHINGSTGATASGSSVVLGYRCRPDSGVTHVYAGNLRTAGTSISGSSGTAFVNISSPLIAPFMGVEVQMSDSRTSIDMTVDVRLVIE